MSYISFKDVTKKYKMGELEIQALNGVNFDVEKGEFVVVVGNSGAGKSTILNILGGMDTSSSGTIIVDGETVSEMDDKQLTKYRRDDIGFVFQFYNLVPNLTVTENVELASQICANPLPVDKMVEAVGLGHRKGNFPSQLSGGEQQRVAIARAIAKNPKLLLCDEPTGALDYNTGKSILQLLQDMCINEKMTVIVITHNTALAPIGNKVLHVKNGIIDNVEVNEKPTPVKDIEW